MGSRLEGLAGLMINGTGNVGSAEPVQYSHPQGITPILIPIAKIYRSPFQPRNYFNPDKINKMAVAFANYREKGEYPRTAILVRPIKDGYELVFGEQRKLAHEKAGFADILAFVDPHITDEEARELSLTENLVREDLSPIEKTEAILNLAAIRLQVTPEEVKQLLDKAANERKNNTNNVIRTSQWEKLTAFFESLPGQITPDSFRANYLPLLRLPEDVMQALKQGNLEYTKARALARIKDSEQRVALLQHTVSKNLSLSEIKKQIAAMQVQKSQLQELPIKNQISEAYKRLQKSSVWKDPSKQVRLQKLMKEIEELLAE